MPQHGSIMSFCVSAKQCYSQNSQELFWHIYSRISTFLSHRQHFALEMISYVPYSPEGASTGLDDIYSRIYCGMSHYSCNRINGYAYHTEPKSYLPCLNQHCNWTNTSCQLSSPFPLKTQSYNFQNSDICPNKSQCISKVVKLWTKSKNTCKKLLAQSGVL